MTELRVFVSSTFRDLQEEREHLVKKVFPEIRARCRARGITFTEVDLRWGLTDEDVVLGQVIRTCLEEIDRCRPYFIGITGERYGYVPELLEFYQDPELLRRYPWLEAAATDGASILDLEFQHGALAHPTDGRAAFFFRGTRRSFDDDAPAAHADAPLLDALKQRVHAAGLPVESFRDPATLGELVYDHLASVIRRDFASSRPPTPLELERSRHDAFAASRRHAYIPNSAYLAELNSWLADKAEPLVIYAESGSGKSSLVSFWCDQLRKRAPGLFVVEHYIGIGAGDSDHIGLIRHVLEEIRERFDRTEEIPASRLELEAQLANWLGFTGTQPMVIVLDGINQLTGPALSLHWLPAFIPTNIRLLVTSTVEGTLVELRSRGWRTLGMQPLRERERAAVVVRFLAEYGKALSSTHTTMLAEDPKCAHPLFLRTVLEELRLDSNHEQLESRITGYLATTGTEDLFQKVLERIEEDFGARAVRQMMSLLWCSRDGLPATELQEITGIAQLRLTTMLAALEYHLVARADGLTFFHDYLRRAVEKRYLGEESVRLETFRTLAEHFEQADVTLASARGLLHALDQLGDDTRIIRALTSFPRLELLWGGVDRSEVLRLCARHDPDTIGRAFRDACSAAVDESPQERALQLMLAGLVCLEAGSLGDARWFMQQRLDVLRGLGDDWPTSDALATLAVTEYKSGDWDGAVRHADEAESRALACGDQRALARALNVRGQAHSHRGAYGDAVECFNQQIAILKECGETRLVALALASLGSAYSELERFDDAVGCYREMDRLSRALGDRGLISIAAGNIGIVHALTGETAAALESYRLQETMSRELGNRQGEALAIGNRGVIAVDQREYAEAVACFREMSTIAHSATLRVTEALALVQCGIAHFQQGDDAEALTCLDQAETIDRELGDQHALAMLLSVRVWMLAELDERERGLACAAEARELMDACGDQRHRARVEVECGRMLVDCTEDESMPGYLPAYVPGVTPDNWREATLVAAGTAAAAASTLAQQVLRSNCALDVDVLLVRVAAATGDVGEAVTRLDAMFVRATNDDETAELHYQRWRLGTHASPESLAHANAALALYRGMLPKRARATVRRRVDELTAAGAA
ncbi:MAG TPA: DUF4062 domain-containing protein [Candidatus Kapabacteria bacterium]|nr:DUF4062 domain-containing protein [Candidatus Kapabacteria bacterium]